MEFCKQFNAATQSRKDMRSLRARVFGSQLHFHHEDAPARCDRKAIGIEKAAAPTNTSKVGKITRKQLEEIARRRAGPTARFDAAVRTIAGSARSMGVDVVE